MPASNGNRGSMNAMRRLLRMLNTWRQRRAARRRAQLHGFMHMSDRMLADIGVRRADIHAALAGMVPVQQIARTHAETPWTAPVHPLRACCRQPAEPLAATDLSAAA